MIVSLCWPLALWLSLGLAGLEVPDGSRPLGIKIEFVTLSGTRLLCIQAKVVVLDVSWPLGLQVKLDVPDGSMDYIRTGKT